MGHTTPLCGDTAGRSGCHTDPPEHEQLTLTLDEPGELATHLSGATTVTLKGGEMVGLEEYVVSRNWSPASVRQRRSLLRQFVEVAGDPATADADDVMRWWASTQHLAPASRRAALIAVRGLLDWLVLAGARPSGDNPTVLIRTPTVPTAPPKVLTPQEVTALRRAVTTVDQHLLVELQLSCGLRIGETAALCIEDLTDEGWLRVHGKGNKVAMVPVPDWLAAEWPTDRTGSLFGVTDWTLRNRVNKLLAAAGIEGHGPHSLRRTCATNLARAGVPLHVVSALLRHQDTSTTAKSYTAISADDLRRAVQ